MGMSKAGFGPIGAANEAYPHDDRGNHLPTTYDVPVQYDPAGRVMLSISDWSRFILVNLAGSQGRNNVITSNTYRYIQSPKKYLNPPLNNEGIALGWYTYNRDWGNGTVLFHSGSNLGNYSVAWVAPNKDFGVLLATNQGGDNSFKALDEAAGALVNEYLKRNR
jgi:hypothetical protein